MALVVFRQAMLEQQNIEGRRNTYRRRQSGIAFLFSGILLTVLAGAVVVISIVLQQTQLELRELRNDVSQISATDSSGNSTRQAEALQEWIATLRSEVAESRVEATKAITIARDEARADRIALRKSLARILHSRGATAGEVLSIVEDLSPTERARFQSELASMPVPELIPDANLTPITPDIDSTPDPIDPANTAADTGTPETSEDPPVAVIVPPDTDDPPAVEDTDTNGTDTSEEAAEEPAVTTYVIKRGDNLSTIARSLGVTEAALRKANNIRNPNIISIGATLKVPTE